MLHNVILFKDRRNHPILTVVSHGKKKQSGLPPGDRRFSMDLHHLIGYLLFQPHHTGTGTMVTYPTIGSHQGARNTSVRMLFFVTGHENPLMNQKGMSVHTPGMKTNPYIISLEFIREHIIAQSSGLIRPYLFLTIVLRISIFFTPLGNQQSLLH